jgi:hypothetical protein
MLFYHVLSALNRSGEDALQGTLSRINDFTAANIILMNDDTAWVAVRHRKDPDYYTMKLYADDDRVIISSETLPGFDGSEWVPLSNGCLVRINLSTLEYGITGHVIQ